MVEEEEVAVEEVVVAAVAVEEEMTSEIAVGEVEEEAFAVAAEVGVSEVVIVSEAAAEEEVATMMIMTEAGVPVSAAEIQADETHMVLAVMVEVVEAAVTAAAKSPPDSDLVHQSAVEGILNHHLTSSLERNRIL